MSFSKFDGKEEVRFGGTSKKFIPDAGRYEVEILDTMDTVFNEKSSITSLVMDFQLLGNAPNAVNDPSNFGLRTRVWFPDGIDVAKNKLKAVIYSAGQVKYFDENYEDVPNMSDANWGAFLKDLKGRLAFRKLGVEIQVTKGNKNSFANIVSFFPVQPPKKTMIETDDNFAWPVDQAPPVQE